MSRHDQDDEDDDFDRRSKAVFHVKGNDVCEALALIKRVVGTAPDNTMMRVSRRQTLEIRAHSDNMTVAVHVPASRADSGVRFSMPLDRLDAVCRRRDTLEFCTPRPGTLTYRAMSGSYAGEVYLPEYTTVEAKVPRPDGARISMDKFFANFIHLIDLKPLISYEMIAFFRCERGMLRLATADNLHAVLLEIEAPDVPDFSLSIPVRYHKMLSAAFGTTKYEVFTDQTFLYATAPNITVRLPLLDVGEITFEKIEGYVTQNAAEPQAVFSLVPDDLIRTFDNLASVNESSQRLSMALGDGFITLRAEGRAGSASDEVGVKVHKVSDATDIHLHFGLLRGVVEKIAKEKRLRVSFIGRSALMLGFQREKMRGSYIVSAVGSNA